MNWPQQYLGSHKLLNYTVSETWYIFSQPLLDVIANLIASRTEFSGRKAKAMTKTKKIQREGKKGLRGKQLNNLNLVCAVSDLNWAIIQNQITILI